LGRLRLWGACGFGALTLRAAYGSGGLPTPLRRGCRLPCGSRCASPLRSSAAHGFPLRFTTSRSAPRGLRLPCGLRSADFPLRSGAATASVRFTAPVGFLPLRRGLRPPCGSRCASPLRSGAACTSGRFTAPGSGALTAPVRLTGLCAPPSPLRSDPKPKNWRGSWRPQSRLQRLQPIQVLPRPSCRRAPRGLLHASGWG
jgi:hypothetical protein